MVEPQNAGSSWRWDSSCSGPSRFTARLLVGVALLGLGALLTMDNLGGATVADGRADLEVNAVMGGIELLVPHDWQVVSAVTAVLGNIEDHSEKIPDGVAPRGTLYLRGAAVMGSVEIRN